MVTTTVPVSDVIPSNADASFAAVSLKLALFVAAFSVIAPLVSLLIATSSSIVAATSPVIVTV